MSVIKQDSRQKLFTVYLPPGGTAQVPYCCRLSLVGGDVSAIMAGINGREFRLPLGLSVPTESGWNNGAPDKITLRNPYSQPVNVQVQLNGIVTGGPHETSFHRSKTTYSTVVAATPGASSPQSGVAIFALRPIRVAIEPKFINYSVLSFTGGAAAVLENAATRHAYFLPDDKKLRSINGWETTAVDVWYGQYSDYQGETGVPNWTDRHLAIDDAMEGPQEFFLGADEFLLFEREGDAKMTIEVEELCA